MVEVQAREEPLMESLQHLYGEEYMRNLPLEALSAHYRAVEKAEDLSDQIPLFVYNNKTYRSSVVKNYLTTGEAIEVLEYQRVAAQEDDLNAYFNLSITMAAILVRPWGEKLPANRGDRDRFISGMKNYWFDHWTYGDHLALTRWFSGQIAQISDKKEFQFFFNGKPKVRSGKRKSKEMLENERINREISNVLGLRAHYLVWQDFYSSFESMFYSEFYDFVFKANLKIGAG